MWERLKSGESWMGIIKNRCKNGDHYWVSAYATPITNDNGDLVEIQSVRQAVPEPELIERAERVYAELRTLEPDKGEVELPGRARFPLPLEARLLLPLVVPAATAAVAPGMPVGPVAQGMIAVTGVIGYLVLASGSLRELSRIRRAARSVVDDSLAERLYVGRSGDESSVELSELYRRTELQAITKRFLDDIATLRGTVAEVVSVMQAARDDATNQSSEVQGIASAMEELTATVGQVAHNASTAAESTEEVRAQATRGRETVERSAGAVHELDERIRSAAEIIRGLADESSRVGQASQIIEGITKQTNLLALNASVEAARAGEAGRSFTVVAEEVRKLAGQTAESTQRIGGIVESLRESADRAVEAMEDSRNRAERTLQHASESTAALAEIDGAIQRIRDMNTQIASATEEQSATTSEIRRNIANAEEVAGRTMDRTREVDQRLQRLSERVESMERLAGRFL